MLTSTLNTALVKPKICRQDGKDCAVLVIMSQSICVSFFFWNSIFELLLVLFETRLFCEFELQLKKKNYTVLY